MSDQKHQSDPRILDRRSLERDHRCLPKLLRGGYSVLDVGCGTGSITAGIASAVGPGGKVLGVDRDRGLIELARKKHAKISNLSFDEADATRLPFEGRFDLVTAARTLQWIGHPEEAVAAMKHASISGGLIVVLDYNHALNEWDPEPPAEFAVFYRAFLAWRQANLWDNEIGNHLPDLFKAAGLADVQSHNQDEISIRGDVDFLERTALWSEVIDNLAATLESAGFCTAKELSQALGTYEPWRKSELIRQRLSMRTVVGRVP